MGWLNDLMMTGEHQNVLAAVDERLYENQKKKSGQPLPSSAAEVAALQEELCRHKLAIHALTRFLVEKRIIDHSELAAFIEEVDAEDGVIDGKLAVDTSQGRPRLVREKLPPKRKMIIPENPGEAG